MSSVKQIQEIIEEGTSLKVLAEAFTDIASIKLRRIRSNIERNRKFIGEIANLYWLVKKEAIKREIIFTAKKKDIVSVLITSNLRFYGNINNNMVQSFIIGTSRYKTDRIVIGLQGKKYLEDTRYFHPFKSFIFKNDIPSNQELKSLLYEISIYKQTFIYYSQMQSVLVQIPTIKDITETQKSQNPTQSRENLDIGFIFEPEVERMIKFFEDQILITLLEQMFLESELSRTASRLVSMNFAQINADKFIKERRKEYYRALQTFQNSRILDSINNLISLRGDRAY